MTCIGVVIMHTQPQHLLCLKLSPDLLLLCLCSCECVIKYGPVGTIHVDLTIVASKGITFNQILLYYNFFMWPRKVG